MDIAIRPCTPDDAAVLSIVGQATFLETYAHMLEAQDIVHHCVHQHSEAAYGGWLAQPDAYGFFLAEVTPNRAPVGFAMLAWPDLPIELREGDLELRRIYLLSRFHGGGSGANLMSHAVEAARRRKARRLLLGVNALNARAIAFYTRQGFVQAGARTFKVGASIHDDLVLAREL